MSNPFFIHPTLGRRMVLCFGIMAVLLFGNCEQIDDLCNGNDCFSFEKFEQGIKDRMEGNATGYGFIVYHQQNVNNLYVSGNRRMDADGEQLFTLTNPMHVASISKSITAMGMMHMLDARNDVSVDDVIEPYLPANWSRGANIGNITFRDLLTHRSGLRSTGYYAKCSHNELKTLIESGVSASDQSISSYQNVNFAMMRLLIPELNGSSPSSDSDAAGYANAFVDYVQDNVFTPAGNLLANRDCKPEAVNPTLYYDFPYGGGNGWDGHGDLTNYSGGFGWHLSLTDLGTLIGKFVHTEQIVSSVTRADMYSGGLGIIQYSGDEGTYYWHNGGWGSGGKGLNTCYMIFPKNNVHAVLFMNSDPAPQSPQSTLADAYDDAWGF